MVKVARRAVLLAAAAAAAAVAVFGVSRLGAGASDRPKATVDQPPGTPVTVQAATAERRVPFGFLGLSLEYQAIEPYAGTDPLGLDPVFEQLVRNLTPGQAPVLRIGGDSADRTWWPTPTLARPPGVSYAVTQRWLAVTRALAVELRARLILGLNLEADSPQLAAEEANALLEGIGGARVRAFELGNEPDLYATFPWYRTPGGHQVKGRPPDYDMSGLMADFMQFAAVLPSHVLAGPSLGAPGWTRDLGRFLRAEPNVGLVTLHRYPLQLCFTPRRSPRYPTVARLLSPAASIGLADSFGTYAAVARAHGRPLRIDELNSVSCGADPAVSQTFASALWALNTLFEMVRVGIHGVNIHTFPGAGYELFRINHRSGHWQAVVAPEYYGLMLFARAAPPGSQLLRVSDASTGAVRTWATRAGDGTIRIVLNNAGGTARRLSIGLAGAAPGGGSGPAGAALGPAVLERLSAPGIRARRGVTLAGQSFAAPTLSGVLTGRARTSQVAAVRGRYAVTLPAGSAAMLVVSPPQLTR
jgi:hypothetical protein